MTDLHQISVISTAENALKKLQRAEIPVFNCKKRGASFIFSVKDKDVKKAFAIFAKPCYNIHTERKSRSAQLLSAVMLRIGIVVGAVVFAVVAFLSNFFILKIEVDGSGSYLHSQVREILFEEGGVEGKPFSAFNSSVAAGRILCLPNVTFCNISRRGSVLTVSVQVDGSHSESVKRYPLLSDTDGVVANIVAICGTEAVAVGDRVGSGDTLIYAYFVNGAGERTECIAVGYAEIECSRTFEYIAPDDSEESLRQAYASALIEEDEILKRTHTATPTDGGVRIIMEVTYLHRISINLT